MKFIPYKKGVLKDIISLVGCNRPVEVGVCLGGLKWRHSIGCSYHMMDVLSGLGVDKGWCMGVSCLAVCVFPMLLVSAWSSIFSFCLLLCLEGAFGLERITCPKGSLRPACRG